MTQTDGEKELVLGNKQLISLFFVVVALCGVFFAVGYMIGRNTSKPASADGASTAAVAPAAAPAQESEPPRETVADTSPAPVDTPPVATPAAPASVAPPEPEPVTKTRPVTETPAVPVAGATYLQVTALRRDDADKLVKTLREQSFPALLAASSKPDLFRVMVGPYHQTADVADAKARLKSLGFANAFVQK
jgi:cell division septation protein DedD